MVPRGHDTFGSWLGIGPASKLAHRREAVHLGVGASQGLQDGTRPTRDSGRPPCSELSALRS
jgi:hypothetical protein